MQLESIPTLDILEKVKRSPYFRLSGTTASDKQGLSLEKKLNFPAFSTISDEDDVNTLALSISRGIYDEKLLKLILHPESGVDEVEMLQYRTIKKRVVSLLCNCDRFLDFVRGSNIRGSNASSSRMDFWLSLLSFPVTIAVQQKGSKFWCSEFRRVVPVMRKLQLCNNTTWLQNIVAHPLE